MDELYKYWDQEIDEMLEKRKINEQFNAPDLKRTDYISMALGGKKPSSQKSSTCTLNTVDIKDMTEEDRKQKNLDVIRIREEIRMNAEKFLEIDSFEEYIRKFKEKEMEFAWVKHLSSIDQCTLFLKKIESQFTYICDRLIKSYHWTKHDQDHTIDSQQTYKYKIQKKF